MRRQCVFVCVALMLWLGAAGMAQNASAVISASNLERMRPSARIDFADFEAKLEIGWFAANDDASEFLVLGPSGAVYALGYAQDERRWRLRQRPGASAFSLIDGIYLQGRPFILHQTGGAYFINDAELTLDGVPVALLPGIAEDELFVEALDVAGQSQFLRYRLENETGALKALDARAFPGTHNDAPVMRIGRIGYPALFLSALADNILYAQIFSEAIAEPVTMAYQLDNGPAVFGAVNPPAVSHFAWTDPQRRHLNRLDLATGENQVVAALAGAYPQFLLLSKDASALLAVNLDFQPEIVAWHAQTGARYDLGAYRDCGRIPDHVALSRDGRALIIGCDSGLEVWRVSD